MIKVTIRFSFQEPHKVQGNLTFRDREFTFDNKDQVLGFYKGLDAFNGKVYEDAETISEVETK